MDTSSAKERRALILRLLEQKGEVQVTELSRDLGISEVTIRKDLTILQTRHLLLRTRGGAMRKPVENLNEDTAISRKRMFNFKEKERIGEEAAKMIKDGDCKVKVLTSNDSWFGVTYKEDKPVVVAKIQSLKDDGTYPDILFE